MIAPTRCSRFTATRTFATVTTSGVKLASVGLVELSDEAIQFRTPKTAIESIHRCSGQQVIRGAVTVEIAPAEPATFTFRNLLTPPGEVGAWHYHPGKMFNVVKRGMVTVEDGCGGGPTYSARQASRR